MSTDFRATLETFPNPYPQRDYTIETICPEFTSLCPKTGQPDFGTLTITYVPDGKCFELKSLKLYLQMYRNHGAFYEHVTNLILDDLVAVTEPRSMKIIGAFTPRGGIRTNVIVEYTKPTNLILDDLVAVTEPRSMKIIGAFTPRGGIRTNVIVEYAKPTNLTAELMARALEE